MTVYSRGDVVLVSFVLADETGKKLRPAVIISTSAYQRKRQEAIVAAITSNVGRLIAGDHLIADWKGAGLLFRSLSTGIIRTIKQSMIDRKLGAMPRRDMGAIDRELRRCLGL